jgi:hypothetical protein
MKIVGGMGDLKVVGEWIDPFLSQLLQVLDSLLNQCTRFVHHSPLAQNPSLTRKGV